MKKKMPSEGLRLGRDSGSILCDTLKKWRFRTGWGGYGLTKGLAKILAPHGITMNGLAPDPTDTPMLMPNGINENISFNNPLGRFEMPCEIANMAVFLVSNMGRAVIGDMVFMTGGSGVVTYDDVNYRF